MAVSRFYNPAPVFFASDGSTLAASGSLQFYEQDTTTAKDTYADAELTTRNQNPVPLDSAGRAATNIWLDGTYSMALLDASGATVWTRDIGSDAASGDEIPSPAGNSGQYLTNDGTALKWADISQVPDPSDLADYVLKSDGTQAFWAEDTYKEADIDYSSTTIRVGGMLIYMGSGSIGTGANVPTKNIDFGITFDAAPKVMLTMTQNGATSDGYAVCAAVTSVNPTYFTVAADTNRGKAITNALTFDYIAIGPYTAE
jgi:hypothetical protein